MTTTWKPKYPYDPSIYSDVQFRRVLANYEMWHRSEPIDLASPLPVSMGWNDVTPEIAEQLLRRNLPHTNRLVKFDDMHKLMRQMMKNQWKRTGEAIIFDEDGVLVNGQHRLLACLLSRSTFPTAIMTGAEPGTFAYMDSGAPRKAATALQTAGFNDGASDLIAAIVQLSEQLYYFTTSADGKKIDMAYHECLSIAQSMPNVELAARLTKTDWKDVSKICHGHPSIVGLLGMQIVDEYGIDTAAEFFTEIVESEEQSAITYAFRETLNENARRSEMVRHAKKMGEPLPKFGKREAQDIRAFTKRQVLGYLTVAFNGWISGNKPNGWLMEPHNLFPRMVTRSDIRSTAAE